MIEQKALAYANMYGVLGSLEVLCNQDKVAKEILAELKAPVAICFDVKDGPCVTFSFTNSGCTVSEGSGGCNCKMNFASPEKFNLLIDKSKPGVPVKGAIKLLAFLLGPFTKLTDRLTQLLRPNEQALCDRDFFEQSTLLTMYTVAGAIAGLANSDTIAKISAGNTVDGDILLGIKDRAYATVKVKDHKFSVIRQKTDNPRAVMEFADIDLANGLFAGTVSTINEMCKGNIRLSGMISMIDNVNRILDRVSLYLA